MITFCSSARAINANILGVDAIESNAKVINEFEMQYKLEGLSAIENNFESINVIAMQCPFVGGEAVIKARVLKELIGTYDSYTDFETCMQLGIYRNTSNSSANKLELTIVPNPAQSWVSVHSSKNIVCIKIYDALFNEVVTQFIKNGINIHTIPIEHLNNGVYAVHVLTDDNTTIVKQLIVLR